MSLGSRLIPVFPFINASGIPSLLDTITGNPFDCASIIEVDKDSE